MTIKNDDSMVINKLEASLTEDASVVIYDSHMFIVQATGLILLAKVCPWWGPTDSQTSNVIAKVANDQYIIYTVVIHLLQCFSEKIGWLWFLII